MNARGDGGRRAVDGGSSDSYRYRRLETFAAALGFLIAYAVTNEVIGAVAVAAVVYAFVHEQLSDEEEGEEGAEDAGSTTPDEFDEPSSSSGSVVDGPEGEVLATSADDPRVSARYDVVVTSPHPVQVELERSDFSDGGRWLKTLVEKLPLRLPGLGEFADPPPRVTEEVKRRVRNDLDSRSTGFDEAGRKVAVAIVKAEGDRFRYEVSYLGRRST